MQRNKAKNRVGMGTVGPASGNDAFWEDHQENEMPDSNIASMAGGMGLRRSPRKGSSAAKPAHHGETADLDLATSALCGIHMQDTEADDPEATPKRPQKGQQRPDDLQVSENSGFVLESMHYTAPLKKGIEPIPRLPSNHSASRSSTRSSPSRPSSPAKRVLGLQMLSRPVRWNQLANPKEIRHALKDHPDAVEILNASRRIIQSQRYLPVELKDELQEALDLDPEIDGYFDTQRPLVKLTPELRCQAAGLHRAISPSPSSEPPMEEELRKTGHYLSLLCELRGLQEVVNLTGDFKGSPRSEAAWNSRIHEAMLQLAVKSCKLEDDEEMGASSLCWAEAENITRANIAKPFLPAAYGANIVPSSSFPAGSVGSATEDSSQITASRMIDFAILLRAPLPSLPQMECLIKSIYHFVDSQPAGTEFFNQTTYEPLVFSPTGVFIETKIDSRRYGEAQNQLGIWLSSWFNRIHAMQAVGTRTPCIPVLLVVMDTWEMWFAIDQKDQIDIVGPVNCGRTQTLDDAYRLLAILRLLVKWVGKGGFRRWVEEVVGFQEQG